MKKKKVLYILNMVLTALIFFIAVFIIISGIIARMNDDVPSVFGYTIHIVVTDSMSPEINPQDFVLAKKSDIKEVTEGDYIIFKSPDPLLNGKIIIHEARVVETVDGIVSITTKGTNNPIDDFYPVTEIIAIYRFHSGFLGKIFSFFTDLKNIGFLIVLIIAVFVIAKYSRKVFRLIKNKEETNSEDAGKTDLDKYTLEELQEMVNRVRSTEMIPEEKQENTENIPPPPTE